MTEFQVLIVPPTLESGVESGVGDNPYSMTQHGGGAKVVQTIEMLGEVWDTVVDKLSALASHTHAASEKLPFQLDSFEFHIGIEAGLAVGIVSKADASVTLTFARRDKDK